MPPMLIFRSILGVRSAAESNISNFVHLMHALLRGAILSAFALFVPLAGAVDFASEVSYELSETSPVDIALADFTNDDFGDMAISMSGEAGGVGSVSILTGDGSGGFPDHFQLRVTDRDGLGYSPAGVASGDFNGDSNLDLAVTAGGAGSTDVHIYLGDGAGGFAFSTTLTSGGQSPWAIVAADFNGDNQVDLAVGNSQGTGFGVSIFPGNGDGTFSIAENVAVTSSIRARDIVTADFDHDGDQDLAIPTMVLRNDGNGGFTRSANIGLSNAVGIAAADLNNDTWTDIAVAGSGTIDVWRNNGGGTFSFDNSYPQAGSQLTAITAVDVDRDSDFDLIVADESANQVKVFPGDGTGNLGVPQLFATGVQPKSVASADWNGDGFPDIAAPYRNDGDTPFASVLLQLPGGNPPSGSVQFSGASYSVAENGTSALITVTRSGGSFGSISVGYASSDGSATAGSDYTTSAGTLDFADGMVSRSFSVPILDDVTYEGDETVSLSLANVTGGATLGSPSAATLTISEDDVQLPPVGGVPPDTTPPVFITPSGIIIDARGPLTRVDLDVPGASDDRDGAITPVPDQAGPFAPGRHRITWSATDSSGNTATAVQILDVRPLAGFAVNQLATPGITVKVMVFLNGEAPEYPVEVGYTVSEIGSDLLEKNRTAGRLSITSGTEGNFDYGVPSGGIANIVVTMDDTVNTARGWQDSHRISITEAQVAPIASLQVRQNGVLTRTIVVNGGLVEVTAKVTDPNLNDSHTFDWNQTDNSIVVQPGSKSSVIFFDPFGLDPDVYAVALSVSDDGVPSQTTSVEILLNVLGVPPVLSDQNDSDGDGLDDASEGIADEDEDGIPDYLDPIAIDGMLPGWLV